MKKLLALFLAIVSVLTFAAIPAFAEESAYDLKDINFISKLGFVQLVEGDEEYISETVITRIQLAEIFYNIIFPDNNRTNEYYGEKDFPDVPAEQKHFAATVYGMGVMRGYSEEVFAPNDPVTYVQAVKAIVSFLGYDLMAQELGGFPSGYLAQATRLKILPGANIPGDAQATYAGVAAMLKKAIGVDIAIWNHTQDDGTAILEVQKGVDYLEYYRGIHVERAVITGNYLTNVKGGDNTNYFGITANGKNFEVTLGAHGIQDLLGYDVYLYYTNEDNHAKLVYFEEGLNDTLTVTSSDIASVSKGKIRYYDGESIFEALFPTDAPLIYNGTFESAYTINDINPFANSTLDGSLTLVDNDNNGNYDIIVVKAYQTMIVSDVIDTTVYCLYDVSDDPMDRVIDLNYYKERNINVRNITGEIIELKNLKKGHVINVCYDKNGIVKEIIASKDSMTGVIDEISYQGDNIAEIKVSGATFKAAKGLTVFDAANKLAPGSVVDIYFNCDAMVAIIDAENRYTDGYVMGYLIDAGALGNLVKEVEVAIFNTANTTEGQVDRLVFADRVVFNDEATNCTDVLTALKDGNKRTKRQVVLFKLDTEGKVVTALQTATKITKDEEAFDGFYQLPGESWYYSGGFKKFGNPSGGAYLANTNTIAFGIPNEENRDDYSKYILTTLPSGEGNNIGSAQYPSSMQLYGTKKEAMVVDVAVINSTQGATDNSRRPFFLVTKVAEAVDEDGESRLRISGTYVEGTSLMDGAFFIDKQLFIDGHDIGVTGDANNGKRPFIDQTETMPAPGDVFRIPSFKSTGKVELMDITEFYQLYDYDSKLFIDSSGRHQQGSASICHELSTVVYKDDSSIKVRFADGTYGAYELSSGAYKFVEVTRHKQTGQITAMAATHEKIRSEETHPGAGSQVLIHYRGTGIGCFIFNDK